MSTDDDNARRTDRIKNPFSESHKLDLCKILQLLGGWVDSLVHICIF